MTRPPTNQEVIAKLPVSAEVMTSRARPSMCTMRPPAPMNEMKAARVREHNGDATRAYECDSETTRVV